MNKKRTHIWWITCTTESGKNRLISFLYQRGKKMFYVIYTAKWLIGSEGMLLKMTENQIHNKMYAETEREREWKKEEDYLVVRGDNKMLTMKKLSHILFSPMLVLNSQNLQRERERKKEILSQNETRNESLSRQ